MAKGKGKIIANRNQGNTAPSEPSSPTKAHPAYSITSDKRELDLKSHLILLMEDFKEDINNSLKEIQENMGQQVGAQKFLKKYKRIRIKR